MISTKRSDAHPGPSGGLSGPKVILREHPPYDTGKVRIGLAYFPTQPLYIDRDMYRVQSAFLGPRSVHRSFLDRLVHCVAGYFSHWGQS